MDPATMWKRPLGCRFVQPNPSHQLQKVRQFRLWATRRWLKKLQKKIFCQKIASYPKTAASSIWTLAIDVLPLLALIIIIVPVLFIIAPESYGVNELQNVITIISSLAVLSFDLTVIYGTAKVLLDPTPTVDDLCKPRQSTPIPRHQPFSLVITGLKKTNIIDLGPSTTGSDVLRVLRRRHLIPDLTCIKTHLIFQRIALEESSVLMDIGVMHGSQIRVNMYRLGGARNDAPSSSSFQSSADSEPGTSKKRKSFVPSAEPSSNDVECTIRVVLRRPGHSSFNATVHRTIQEAEFLCACGQQFKAAEAMRDHTARNSDPNHSIKFPSDPLPREARARKRAKIERLIALENDAKSLQDYNSTNRDEMDSCCEDGVELRRAVGTAGDHEEDLSAPGGDNGGDAAISPEVDTTVARLTLWDIVDIGEDKDEVIKCWESDQKCRYCATVEKTLKSIKSHLVQHHCLQVQLLCEGKNTTFLRERNGQLRCKCGLEYLTIAGLKKHALNERFHPLPSTTQPSTKAPDAVRRSSRNRDAHHSARNLPLVASITNPDTRPSNKAHSPTPPPFRQEDLEFLSPSAHRGSQSVINSTPSFGEAGSDSEFAVSRKRKPEVNDHQDLEPASSAKRTRLERAETQPVLPPSTHDDQMIEAIQLSLPLTIPPFRGTTVTAHDLQSKLSAPLILNDYCEPEDNASTYQPMIIAEDDYSEPEDPYQPMPSNNIVDDQDLQLPHPTPFIAQRRSTNLSSAFEDGNRPVTIVDQSSDNLVDDELLRPFNFAINIKRNICICLICEFAVAPDQLLNHSVKHTKATKLTHDDASFLIDKYHLTCADSTPNPTNEIAPLPGLKQHHGAFHCRVLDNEGRRCATICTSTSSQQKHMSSDHRGVASYGTSLSPYFWEANCTYQFYFTHRHRFFRVYPELTPASDGEDRFSLYYLTAKSALENQPASVPEDLYDRREVNVWLAESGWPQIIDGYSDWQALIAMITLNDPISDVLQEVCEQFVVDMAEQADQSLAPVRKWLLSTDGVIGKRKFKKVIPTTLRRYGSNMAKFCRCIIRSLDNPEDVIPFVLTEKQLEAAHILRRACRHDGDDIALVRERTFEFCYLMLSEMHPTTSENERNCPTLRFLVLMSLRVGGAWIHARQIAVMLSELQYWQRLVIFSRMVQTASNYEGGLIDACHHEHQYLDEGNHNTFSIARDKMHLATAIAYTDPTLPRFTSEDNDAAFTIDGDYISLNSLRQWAKEEIVSLRHFVDQTLFFGQGFSASRHDHNWIKDNYRNTTEGYSFLQEEGNPFRKQRFILNKLVLDSPTLRRRFRVFVNGKWTWKRTAVISYLEDCGEAWSRLSVCMQYAGGLPQRGSEVSASKICNNRYRVRSVYIFHRLLTIVGFYSKKTHNLQCDDILFRTFPDDLAAIALDMVSILRPFEIILASEEMEPALVVVYQNCLFVRMGKQMMSKDLSEAFADSTMAVLGVRIGYGLWRQISEYLRKKHCRVLKWVQSTQDDYGLEQGGHGKRTVDIHYGREVREDITMEKLEACEYMSKEWHHFLHLGPAVPRKVPVSLEEFFGDDAVAALASLDTDREELKSEIQSLRKDFTMLKELLLQTLVENTQFREIIKNQNSSVL